MSSVIAIDVPQVREIAVDADGGTFASSGHDRDGRPVLILTFAIVTPPASAEPERAIVFASGDVARRMGAIASQGEIPFRARAVFEGTHWRVLSLAHG